MKPSTSIETDLLAPPRPGKPGNSVSRANYKTPGIRLPATYIVSAARRRTDREARAMRWLSNYAAITGSELEDFCEPIGLDERQLREALCALDADAATRDTFTRGVEKLRKQFEALLDKGEGESPFRPGSAMHDGCRPIASTSVSRRVTQALKHAAKYGAMGEIIGLTRIGKTTPAVHWFLRNLDTALYVSCPTAAGERDWLIELAKTCCIAGATGGGKWLQNAEIRERIAQVFGRGGWSFLVVDEAHNVFLRRGTQSPVRLEFLRALRDNHGVGIGLLATPQFTEHLSAHFRADARWAGGQYDGRATTCHLPETLDNKDLTAVAMHHAPDFGSALIAELVAFAERSQGYCGAMVNLILRAREVFEEFPGTDRVKLLQETIKRQEKGRHADLKASGKLEPMRFGKVIKAGGAK